MKKHIFFLMMLGLSIGSACAQKFGYVNTEFILSKLPAYKEAQQEIDKLSKRYQQEIIAKHKGLDSLQNVYDKEEILYTEEMKRKKQAELEEKKSEISEFQNSIFGYEGRIFLKRQELIRPIQDEVYAAIEKVSKKNSLQFMFDKAGDLVILYTTATHDYTDFVLEELGEGDKIDVKDNK